MSNQVVGAFTRRDLAIVLVVVMIWALNYVALKFGLRVFTPLQLGMLRFVFSSIPLIFLVPVPKIDFKWVVFYGLLQGIVQFGFLILALKVGMTAALAPVVMQMQIFVTALLGVLILGEKLNRTLINGLVVAGIGLLCLGASALASSDVRSVTISGILLALLGACGWAGSNIVVRKLYSTGVQYSPISLVTWAGVVTSIGFALLSLIFDPLDAWNWSHVPLYIWAWVVYLGWIGNALSFGLWALLLGRYAANRVAPYSLGTPAMGMLAGILILGETVTLWQLIGGGLVMLAFLFVVLNNRAQSR